MARYLRFTWSPLHDLADPLQLASARTDAPTYPEPNKLPFSSLSNKPRRR